MEDNKGQGKGKKPAQENPGKITGTLKTLAAFFGKASGLLKAKTVPLTTKVSPLAAKAGPLKAKAGSLAAFSLQKIKSLRFMDIIVTRAKTFFIMGKKQPMFFLVGGLVVLFLVLLISALALVGRGADGGLLYTGVISGIPPEELFIPAEPDFVPGFILEREPRHFWSIDDIRPYWRSSGDPGFWQEVLRSAVDEIMQNVP